MGLQRRSPGPLLTGLSVGLLIFSWTNLAHPTDLSALAHHPHLCQTTRDTEGRHYPGFFCPRLSDTPEEAYCCHLQAAGGSCCTRDEFEALYQVNLSSLQPPPILRGPGPLLALGLYSLLLLALMTADFVHFCRGRGRKESLNSSSRRLPFRASAARPLLVPVGTD
ncbi:protein shisa-like-1a [Cricetulus griseus]|uniref:Protein shisa-like-1a n=1 Tax=Cricetulus griseus TaxID=10029 RepID=A0A9J7K5F3_CRIGR|nr:protein shisa-like-1a [Cricetulus griseus]XP_035298327.1 protein shisa-like-1a [Cricetulus griseus]